MKATIVLAGLLVFTLNLHALPKQGNDNSSASRGAPAKVDPVKIVAVEVKPVAADKPDAVATAKVSESVLINISENALNIAVANSQINSGISAAGADIKSSKLKNTNTGVTNTAINNSSANSGINVKKAEVQKWSFKHHTSSILL